MRFQVLYAILRHYERVSETPVIDTLTEDVFL